MSAKQENVYNHLLQVKADQYACIDSDGLPTGKFQQTKDTAFDFLQPTTIGEQIIKDDKQLQLGKGFDHPFIFNTQMCIRDREVPEGTSDLTVCADHYHHFKEDIALMAEMGFKTYRFSISWSRVLPQGTGKINPKGIEFYNQLIDECLKYNIIPCVTMFHFDMPAALDEKGGCSCPESVEWFLEDVYKRQLLF